MRTCCCVNQCPACGQCCQVPCAHRGVFGGEYGSGSTTGKVEVIPPSLTEEDVRRIIREELDRAKES